MNLAQVNRILRIHNEISKITIDWMDYVGKKKVDELSRSEGTYDEDKAEFKKKETDLYYRSKFAFHSILELILELKEHSGVLAGYCESLTSIIKTLSVEKTRMEPAEVSLYNEVLKCIDDFISAEKISDLQRGLILCRESLFE